MRYVRGEDAALSVGCKFKNHSVTRIATLTFAGDKAMPSTSKSVANVVLIPDGVIFLIELALPLPTKRFPLGSNTIISGFEIPANVFSVKTMSSVEENSRMRSCRRAPTSKLVAAYPMSERNTVAKQATANLRYMEA